MATKNKGDVDLVVRARDSASKTLDTVNKALTALVDNQGDLSSSASKTAKSMGSLAQVAVTIGNAYNKIATDADKAATTVARQEAQLQASKATYAALERQIESAAAVHGKLVAEAELAAASQSKLRIEFSKTGQNVEGVKRAMERLTAEQTEAESKAKLVAKAQADLVAQAKRMTGTISEQEAAYQKSFYALQSVSGNAADAAKALDKVRTAQERLNQANAAAGAATSRDNRRSNLTMYREMAQATRDTQAEWKAAEQAIRELNAEITRNGSQTSEQLAQMERLKATASANKQAYIEIRAAVAQYGNALRNKTATEQQSAAAQERARVALVGAKNAMVQMAPAARQSASGAEAAASATDKAANANKKLDAALQSLFANSRRSLSMYQRIRGEVLALTSSYLGLYAAIEGGRKILDASMSTDAIESRLNVITNGDMKKTGEEMQWVREQSERLGFDMRVLGSEWSKFGVAAQASNMPMDEARKIFLSVAEAGRVLKLDTQRVEMAFMALTQMISKGTIQAEELRQQLGEHIPGAFGMMAEAAGVSAAQLSKMMEQGQLTSDYLVKFADVLDKRFGQQLSKSLEMTQAELGRFQTAMFMALNEIGEAGAIDAFTDALRKLQQMLKSPEAGVWFDRIGKAAELTVKFLMTILSNLDLIGVALVGLGTAKGVAYILRLYAEFVKVRGAIAGATTAARGLSIAMAGMGGPLGIAIGLAATAFATLAMQVSEADKATGRAAESIDKVRRAYKEAADEGQNWAKVMKENSSLQMARDYEILSKKLKDELATLRDPFGASFMTRANNSNSPLKGVYAEINNITRAARNGQISIEEFRQRLNEIGEANPTLQKTVLALIDASEGMDKTQKKVAELGAAMRLMRGEASDADKKVLGLAEATDSVADAQARGTQQMTKYTEAMDRLGKSIPELKAKMEFEDGFKAISKDLQIAFDNAGGDPKLQQAAMDRAAQATAALRDGYNEAMIKAFKEIGKGDGLVASVELLKNLEGFKATPYWDVNADRIGYGSDTVTLSDGSIQKVVKGMSITQEDAMRDLVRRIGEFQEGAKRSIGDDRWNAMNADQQAAITSLVYNYGSLSRDVLSAVREALKNGSAEEVAKAIRDRAGDNNGVNNARRNREADLFLGNTRTFNDSTEKRAADRDERLNKVLSDLASEMRKGGMTARDKYIEEKVNSAQPPAGQRRLSDAEAAKVAGAAGDAFDAAERVKTEQKILQLTQQLAESRAGITKQEYIELAARRDGVNLLTEQGAKYAELQGLIYDRANVETNVNRLLEYRSQLMEQLDNSNSLGDNDKSATLEQALVGVNTQLTQAIEQAKQFYAAMGGPGADIAIAKLDNLQFGIERHNKLTLDAKAINQQFAAGATQGFTSIAQAMAGWIDGSMSGKDAIESMGNAFRQFAADFLIQIAQMILQQAIFNAMQSMGGGGIGGMIAGIFRHQGGLANGTGHSRSLPAGIFANAVRYHTGGIAGLKPNEVPAVLEKNEEVLTRDDPRHIMNGGGAGSGGPTSVKVVNMIDSGDFVSEGLNSPVGEKAILNFMRNNRSAVKSALG